MKTRKYRLALFLPLLLAVNLQIFAAGEELKKNFHKEYPVTPETLLEVQNKFGNVNIINWEKNQVSIDVNIILEHPDKEKAARLLEYINVDFSQTGNVIRAVTVIDNKFSTFQTGWGSNQKKFSIDYEIYIPKTLNINLLNKYGSVYADELAGLVRIEIKYGKLSINNMSRGSGNEKSSLVVAYSECNVTEANWLKVEMKYSKLRISNAQVLGILSKYSDLNLGIIRSVVLESSYDNYKFDRIGTIKAQSSYTNYTIDRVEKKLNLVTAYGGMTVNLVDAGFENIDLTGKYAKMVAFIDPDASYMLNGTAEYSKIKVPSGNKLSRIIQNTSQTLKGVVGTNPNPDATVNISTKYGEVVLVK